MAQSAWRGPALRLSSWSCIGPRRRATEASSGGSVESSVIEETSEVLLTSSSVTTISTDEAGELPAASNVEWTSKAECSYSSEIAEYTDDDAHLNGDVNLTGHNIHEDHMNDVELWQQLEDELYNRSEGEDEADVEKEIREEEAAAIAEVGEGHPEGSEAEKKEAHRFFPPGKIMHIVTLQSDCIEGGEGDDPSLTDPDKTQAPEAKVGIFLTPRSLYSKLRLSQRMISDHFMPVYRRQIEKLIKELEMEEAADRIDCDATTAEVAL